MTDMGDWLSEIEERNKNTYVAGAPNDEAIRRMARVIRELADVASATVPAYKRLVLLQKMGPLGESPLWTKKIGEALDNLSPDAKEIIEESGVASYDSPEEESCQ